MPVYSQISLQKQLLHTNTAYLQPNECEEPAAGSTPGCLWTCPWLVPSTCVSPGSQLSQAGHSLQDYTDYSAVPEIRALVCFSNKVIKASVLEYK